MKRITPIGCLTNVLIAAAILGSGDPLSVQAADSNRYDLKMRQSYSEVADVQVAYEVQGQLVLPGETEAEKLDLEVTANLVYQDRLLFFGEIPEAQQGAEQEEKSPSVQAARYYDQVDVAMKINNQERTPLLRDQRRLIGVQRKNTILKFHSPTGPLCREEIDLIHLPGDPYVLQLILPNEPIAIGTSWEQDASALAALLGLDAVGESDVKSELKSVERGYAKVEFSGNIQGATVGVASEIAIKARYYFDLRRGKIASLQMVGRERRGIGHVSPGIEATFRLKMVLEPRTDAGKLSDGELVSMRGTAHWDNQQLAYHSAVLGVSLQHDQHWFVTAEDDRATVLRRVHRGELIAQCNVSALPDIKKGKAITLSQFQEDIKKNLGTNFGTFVNAGESTSRRGHLVYRVEVAGTASELPVRWIYYSLTDTQGHRLALVFTMEGDLVQSFGAADREIVEHLAFIARTLPKTASPTEASNGKKESAKP